MMVEMLLGIPIGILTSLFAWWILFHAIVPKIEFSEMIAKDKNTGNPTGYRYRIKMENAGNRSAVDIELFARLRIKGIKDKFPMNWEVLYPPVGYGRIPKLRPVRRSKSRLAVQVRLGDIDEFGRSLLPAASRAKIENGTVILEDLLSLGKAATLQVHAFAYDEFSGARKVFESPIYTIDHIKHGVFDRRSLKVIEANSDENLDD